MSFFRKLKSAFGFLVRGDFVHLFNAMTAFLRLQPALMIGDTRFFSIESFEELVRTGKTVPGTTAGFVDDIRCENGVSRIDDLLACMEGTSDYPSLKPEKRREKFESLFQGGSRVWLALDGETVVGFIWETPGVYCVPYGETKIHLELPPQTAFLEFLFVNGNYRRRGVHTALLDAATRSSPDVRFSCLIAEDNIAAIRSHEKFGFHASGRVLHFRLFGLVFASFRFEKTKRCLFRIRRNIPYTIKMIEWQGHVRAR